MARSPGPYPEMWLKFSSVRDTVRWEIFPREEVPTRSGHEEAQPQQQEEGMGSSSPSLGPGSGVPSPWRGLLKPTLMRRLGSWVPIPWKDFVSRRGNTAPADTRAGAPGCVLFMTVMFRHSVWQLGPKDEKDAALVLTDPAD